MNPVEGHRRLTAKELMEELDRDPEFVPRRRDTERVARARRRRQRLKEAPILAELAEAGFDVDSVADLYNRRLDYRAAIPILMRWLRRASDPDTKEAIVRALSVRWAQPNAAPLLLEEFRRVSDDPTGSLRWAIGNALAVVADDRVFDELVSIARDRRYGRSREMVVVALGSMRDARGVDVLLELLEDDEVAGHALSALRKLRIPAARPAIERFLDHPKAWIRREARKALADLDAQG